jgi:hypothetical protein
MDPKMPILSDIQIKINAEDVLLAMNNGRKSNPKLIDETVKAIETAEKLWQPRAVYEDFTVIDIEGEEILLAPRGADNGTRLKIGPHIDLLAMAESAMISVVTVGSQLDHRITELNRGNHLLEAYLLDSVGVVALTEVDKAVRQRAEQQARNLNWGVSERLGPGSLMGWDLTGQSVISSLVDIKKIDLTINESCVLMPFKSASSLIGMGPAYPSKKVGSICRFCMHAGSCWRKREN